MGTAITKRTLTSGELRPVEVLGRPLGGENTDPPRHQAGRPGHAKVGGCCENELEERFHQIGRFGTMDIHGAPHIRLMKYICLCAPPVMTPCRTVTPAVASAPHTTVDTPRLFAHIHPLPAHIPHLPAFALRFARSQHFRLSRPCHIASSCLPVMFIDDLPPRVYVHTTHDPFHPPFVHFLLCCAPSCLDFSTWYMHHA